MINYNRRSFLKISTPLFLSFLPFKYLPIKLISDEKNHLFLDESNLFSNDDIFGIGLLHSSDLQKTVNAISYLRSKNKYKSELTYRSTDKHKVQFSKDLIDFFFNEQTLKFSARVISGRIDSSRSDYSAKKESSYQLHYKQIIGDSFVDDNSVIHLENRSLYNADKKLAQFLIKSYNASLEYIQYPKSDLSQLSDLFTGCIIGDTRSLTNPSKVEILNYLKNKLEIKYFSELYNIDRNGKFKIIKTQI